MSPIERETYEAFVEHIVPQEWEGQRRCYGCFADKCWDFFLEQGKYPCEAIAEIIGSLVDKKPRRISGDEEEEKK